MPVCSPGVSILIPCYNAAQWIGEAIRSALDQTYSDLEVLVVDDGSTDASLDIIRGFGDAIRWQSGPNQGGNVARNRLLKMAQGEWLQYLDADDCLLPHKIEKQLAEGDSRASDVLWSPSVFEFHRGAEVRRETQDLHDEDPWTALVRWHLPQTGASLWRRRSVESVGGWKESQPCCQEHELYLRLLKSGAKFQYCPTAASVYRHWSEQTVCRRDPLRTYRHRLAIIDDACQFLQQSGQLTAERRTSVMAATIQCARSLYAESPEYAREVARQGRLYGERQRLPAEPWFPPLYRTLFAWLGFDWAERTAAAVRRLRRPFRSRGTHETA